MVNEMCLMIRDPWEPKDNFSRRTKYILQIFWSSKKHLCRKCRCCKIPLPTRRQNEYTGKIRRVKEIDNEYDSIEY